MFPEIDSSRHVVVICGGAVAGSEAAALCARRGAVAIVLEQGVRPYGKIEDGLPRWHVGLRDQEYAKIDENLTTPGVLFVPRTRVGHDVSADRLRAACSALVLANGAWRDRPLPVEGIEPFVGKGLVYQNPFVYWFNHYVDANYSGPTYDIPDGAIVVGGGLASIDVVKIINLELYARALRQRDIAVDMVELEVKGIPDTLAKHGLAPDALGIRGCTLFYRRRKEDMPLASMDNPTPEQQKKLEVARGKILDKVMRKYLVHFEGSSRPVAPLAEAGTLRGLVFRRTQIVDRKVIDVPGSDFEARSNLVVSSIGSIPEPMPGMPMRGELYSFANYDTGEVTGLEGVFGLGNVLTGQGNIKASRDNAREIAESVLSAYLGVAPRSEGLPNAIHAEARSAVEPVVDRALERAPLPRDKVESLFAMVRDRWQAVGYSGNYRAWIDASRA